MLLGDADSQTAPFVELHTLYVIQDKGSQKL